MKSEIIHNIDNPAQLERLYREDKSSFKRAFTSLYADLKGNSLAEFWHTRLNFTKDEIAWGTSKDLLFIILAALFAGLIAKLPALLHIDEEFFYTRNAGFILAPVLIIYFAWKNKLPISKIVLIVVASLAGLVFINTFPNLPKSDTLVLSCLHLILFLWAITGFAFVGDKTTDTEKRLAYLRFNGDLVVMTTLIVIAGGILSGITIGLFELIGFDIKTFYFENVVIFFAPTAPIVGAYLIRTNPQLVGKVSPVIAKIFSPAVLLMLVTYLVAIIYSGKDPYNDREFLLLFNALLIGVMAIIFFSVAESSRAIKKQAEMLVLLLLSAVTIIVNCIALSAILFRISAYGLSPNRAAVLGGNVLILINLLLVTAQLYRVISKKTDNDAVGKVIATYLPVYIVWAVIVTFIFPFLFGHQ